MKIPSPCDGSTPPVPLQCDGGVALCSGGILGTGDWEDMGGSGNEERCNASEMRCHPCDSDEARPRNDTLELEGLRCTGGMVLAEGEDDRGCRSDNFLHQRRVDVEGSHQRSDKGPGIGEGELAVVHYMIHWQKHCAQKPTKWLVTSTDTDQIMIILLPWQRVVCPPSAPTAPVSL